MRPPRLGIKFTAQVRRVLRAKMTLDVSLKTPPFASRAVKTIKSASAKIALAMLATLPLLGCVPNPPLEETQACQTQTLVQDSSETRGQCLQAALKGDPTAQNYVGMMYIFGYDVEVDVDEAGE